MQRRCEGEKTQISFVYLSVAIFALHLIFGVYRYIVMKISFVLTVKTGHFSAA